MCNPSIYLAHHLRQIKLWLTAYGIECQLVGDTIYARDVRAHSQLQACNALHTHQFVPMDTNGIRKFCEDIRERPATT